MAVGRLLSRVLPSGVFKLFSSSSSCAWIEIGTGGIVRVTVLWLVSLKRDGILRYRSGVRLTLRLHACRRLVL